jgi:hypothetical protein
VGMVSHGGSEVRRTLESWWVGWQAGREAGVIEGLLSVGGAAAGVRGLTFGGWVFMQQVHLVGQV